MKHAETELRMRCLTIHYDENGKQEPQQCIKCANCWGWIRPEDMDEECPTQPKAVATGEKP